jgi:hypothetical protein
MSNDKRDLPTVSETRTGLSPKKADMATPRERRGGRSLYFKTHRA